MNLKETLQSAWHIPDIRARIIFVMAMFGVYAFGLHIPVPGLDPVKIQHLFGTDLWMMLDMFTGGAMRKVSILALGLNPYITASIIMQLLTVAVPSLQQMQREQGEFGKRQINRYIRYMTIVLAILQGLGIGTTFARQSGDLLTWSQIIVIVLFWTAGSMFLVWLGEQITEKGIGNGISLLIFAGIVAQLPMYVWRTWEVAKANPSMIPGVIALAVIFLFTIWAIVMVTKAQRRIPIQQARRIIGQRAMGGQTTYLPISVNTAGVIPIIFAMALIMLPQQFANMLPQGSYLYPFAQGFARLFTPGLGPIYMQVFSSLLYGLLIFGFTYFYTAVIYKVDEIADNLKKGGSFVPGIRPGKPTEEYLDKVISRMTAAGAVFLALIALMQYWVPSITGVQTFSLIGGTSLLIVVGVALDTVQQIEAQLLMRQYEGFIK